MDLGKTAHAFGGIAQSRSRAALFQYLRLRSAAATRSMAPMRPLVPRVMRARVSIRAAVVALSAIAGSGANAGEPLSDRPSIHLTTGGPASTSEGMSPITRLRRMASSTVLRSQPGPSFWTGLAMKG